MQLSTLNIIYVLYFLDGPKPIKLLQAFEIDINFVNLRWDVYDDAGAPDHYLISYRNNDNGVVTYKSVASNERTYKIQNLTGNTPYTIRMVAVKDNLNSSVVSQGLRTRLGKLNNVSISSSSMGLIRYK